MKKRFSVVLAASVLVVVMTASLAFAGGLPKPISKNAEAQKLIEKAWALDKSDSGAEIYKQCIALMEQADKLDPNNITILVDLSRYYWNYGDNLPKVTPEQKKFLVGLYDKGMASADKSLKIKETVPAHYWFAVNKASSLEFSSIVSQAAGFPTIYKHAQYVKKNDPAFYYGADGRLWSEILVRVPKKVVEMVGQSYVKEAVEEIDNAIKVEPRFLENYVYKARFVNAFYGRKDEALKLLDLALKADPAALPEETTSNKFAQKAGRSLWKQITGKEYPAK